MTRDQAIDLDIGGDWGDADSADVRAVCLSVASCFAEAFEERAIEPLLVEYAARPAPRVCYERTPAGKIRILLTVQGQYWAQLAYQFAHELVHVLTNFYDTRDAEEMEFDDTLSEAGALFALRRLARVWATSPPFESWRSYARHLASYAENVASGNPAARRLLPLAECPHFWRAARHLHGEETVAARTRTPAP